MLCRKCWTQDASVHFRYVCGGEVQELVYCLACAQDEAWSWLLAWGHSRALATHQLFPTPIIVHSDATGEGRLRATRTLVATGLLRCGCGCRIVAGAEVACGHGTYTYEGQAQLVPHVCHCGRDHTVVVPHVVCEQCVVSEGHAVIATAQTCLHDEQRRRIVHVSNDMQRQRTTWGTFSVRN